MFTFLPHSSRQSVTREYKKRLFFVYLVSIICLGFAWIASLVPSYVLVSARLSDAESRKSTLAQGGDTVKIDETEKELDAIRQKITILGPISERVPVSTAIAQLFSRVPEGVVLSSFSIRRQGGAIVVSGTAKNRETLVAFSKALEGDAFFKKVELPVSNFTKGKDVPFTMSLSGSF